jgi:hypothetical protein
MLIAFCFIRHCLDRPSFSPASGSLTEDQQNPDDISRLQIGSSGNGMAYVMCGGPVRHIPSPEDFIWVWDHLGLSRREDH